MPTEKPQTVSGYSSDWVELVRRACLYVATVLGDLIDDQLVIVGGLVPGLLVSQEDLTEGMEPHAGTMDLDLGLKLGILEGERYREVAKRLRDAGFDMDKNEQGNPTLQRWKIETPAGKNALIDFLIPPASDTDKPGELFHLEKDFAAIITPGLSLAFRDRERVLLSGLTILEEEASREMWVCGPGAFVVLKTLAFKIRGLPKDAYDLYYLIRNYGEGVNDVADRLRPLLSSEEAQNAIEILQSDFASSTSPGPMRAASFLEISSEESLREDIVGFVQELVSLCK